MARTFPVSDMHLGPDIDLDPIHSRMALLIEAIDWRRTVAPAPPRVPELV